MFVVTLIALVGQEVERPLTRPLNLCDRTPLFSSYPIFFGTGISFLDRLLSYSDYPLALCQFGIAS